MNLDAWNFIEIALSILCLVIVCYNIKVIVKKRVYQSWSGFSMLLSFCLLLLCRACYLLFFVFAHRITHPSTYLFTWSMLQDMPYYLFLNITLVLIW